MVIRSLILGLLLLAPRVQGLEYIRHLPAEAGLDGIQLRDSTGSFWIFEVAKDLLWKWDGMDFRSYSFHHLTDYKYRTNKYLREDSRQRIWIYATCSGQPEVFIFDPAQEAFVNYGTMREALEKELHLHPELRFTDSKTPNPDICNGQALFVRRYEPTQLFHYDGTVWHAYPRSKFTHPNISIGDEHVRMGEDGTLFFIPFEQDPDTGRTIRKECKLEPGSKDWKITKTLLPWTDSPKSPRPPKELNSPANQCKQDSEGDWWVIDDGYLMRYAFGTKVRYTNNPLVFDPDPRLPERYPTDLNEVRIDPYGNRLLKVYYPNRIFAVMTGVNPPRATVEHTGTQQFESKFSLKTSQQDSKFVYRLDKADWSKPTLQSQLQLIGLQPGTHTLDVLAIDENLNRANKPTSVEFRIEGTLEGQNKILLGMLCGSIQNSELAKEILESRGFDVQKEHSRILIQNNLPELISKLYSDNPAQRNEAALLLTKGNAHVRAHLETLLETADDDLAWRLNAILQQLDP